MERLTQPCPSQIPENLEIDETKVQQQRSEHQNTGTCTFCNQKAGILSREHPECRRAHQAGWQEMVQLAAQAAGSPDFDENQLRLTMAELAQRSYGDGDTVNQTLETGWKLGVNHSMADGIITPDEEARLREFRDQLALGTETADPGAMGVPFAYGVCPW